VTTAGTGRDEVKPWSADDADSSSDRVDANGTFSTPIVMVVEAGSSAVIGASLKYAASAGDLRRPQA
jgi:hypothetical protein